MEEEEESSATRKRPHHHHVLCESSHDYYSDIPVPDLPVDIWINIVWMCESPRTALWLLSSTRRLWHVLKGNVALTRVFQDIKRACKVIDHAQTGYRALRMQPHPAGDGIPLAEFTTLMWHRDGLRVSMRSDCWSTRAFDRRRYDLDAWVLLDPLHVPFHWITYTIMSIEPPIPGNVLEIDSVCINSLDELVQAQLCEISPKRLLSIDVHTEELCLAAINSPNHDACSFSYHNFKLHTHTVLLAMNKRRVSFMLSIPPSAQTDALCIAAIKHDFCAYSYIHMPSEAVYYEVIRLNPLAAMRMISQPTYEMCATALQVYKENYPTQRTWHRELCMSIRNGEIRRRLLRSFCSEGENI